MGMDPSEPPLLLKPLEVGAERERLCKDVHGRRKQRLQKEQQQSTYQHCCYKAVKCAGSIASVDIIELIHRC